MGYLPITVELTGNNIFYGGQPLTLTLNTGLCILVGPNGAGKTEVLKKLRDHLRQRAAPPAGRIVVYLSAGRNSIFEQFRSFSGYGGPGYIDSNPAAVGNQGWGAQWWRIEGATGMLLRLKDRPDLLLKVEARLQALYQRRLRLNWGQSGLQIGFVPTTGGQSYFANAEASGLLQLIPLLAAIYDDQIGALIIDEPEISLHPQLQAFLLQEMATFAGDPAHPNKKVIVTATHSPTMLPVRRIEDLTRLVFFTDQQTIPIQIPNDAGELKNTKLNALIARLSENHKLALFGRSVLLVEGPSDEIVVSGLSNRLERPLLGSNTQVVPVTGKGQFAETVKLFRLTGKHVFVLADLDALADGNQLLNVFRDTAQQFANEIGMESVHDIDRSIRDKLNLLLDKAFAALSEIATNHRYWTGREHDPAEELKAKRRATLATLLSVPEKQLEAVLDGELLALRKRYDALLAILDKAGCVILRRGTIEDYYFNYYPPTVGKPEAAAADMEYISTRPEGEVRIRYGDIVRAINIAAPLKKVDENALLREQLGSLLGAAMLVVHLGMPDDELNARAATNFGTEALVFRFANRSIQTEGRVDRRIEVSITSPLFRRDGFPFEITERDNLTAVVEQKLPVA